MTMETEYDVVVVGSGFGGSICALRAAQAGLSVVVLERGRRYEPTDFPRDVRDTDALLWRYDSRRSATGLYDLRAFSGLAAVVASGVGGGSLIYANIHIRPDPVAFDDPRWPAGTNRATLDPYYDKVASTIGLAPVPAYLRLPKLEAFHQAGARLGREVFDPEEAVSWPAAPPPGHDRPLQPGPDTDRGVCQMIAECEFGCPLGAKRSMDRTYLAAAEGLGADVRPGHLVSYVQRTASGYAVSCRNVSSGEQSLVAGRTVVVAAGTLGTNEILLRSRDVTRTLPALSDRVGHGFSANGDFLGSIHGADMDLEPSYGPDVTSVMRFFDTAPQFTMAAPTFNAPVMRVLTSLGQPSGRWLRPVREHIWPRLPRLLELAFSRGMLSGPPPLIGSRGDPRRTTNLFCIGRDSAGGTVRLGRDGLDVTWAYAEENHLLITRMEAAMKDVADSYGGRFAPLFTWNTFRRIITVHPLGGCAMADDPASGVVSPDGEVHGYERLFVADGSVVPTSIGFHPAMTISAIAERTAESLVASFRAR